MAYLSSVVNLSTVMSMIYEEEFTVLANNRGFKMMVTYIVPPANFLRYWHWFPVAGMNFKVIGVCYNRDHYQFILFCFRLKTNLWSCAWVIVG